MKKKPAIQRVDIQVTVLVAILIVISTSIVFAFAYTLSYRQMLQSLEDRVTSLALFLDKELPTALFTEITNHEDMSNAEYLEAQVFLSRAREITSAQYLYTATKNKDGKLIYHIDGLPTEADDFRKPGDLIEKDFIEDLTRALANEVVMPDDIKETEWGDVFVAYYPLHDKSTNTVIGAIGVEFPASREHDAYFYILTSIPVVIFITCLVASIFSHLLFRRISNPHFKDLSNTDSLTGLKNRNAYDLDMENLLRSGRIKKYALVLSDLNGLKTVNDTQGHKAGDAYIQQFSRILKEQDGTDHVSYRIGGDEFATFFFDPDPEDVATFSSTIKARLIEVVEDTNAYGSVSVGFAFADGLTLESWKIIQAEADAALYQDKKAFYATHENCDNRRNGKVK